jgi:hypothetical protein
MSFEAKTVLLVSECAADPRLAERSAIYHALDDGKSRAQNLENSAQIPNPQSA